MNFKGYFASGNSYKYKYFCDLYVPCNPNSVLATSQEVWAWMRERGVGFDECWLGWGQKLVVEYKMVLLNNTLLSKALSKAWIV